LRKIKELCESIDWKIILKNEYYSVEKIYNNPDPADPSKTIPEKRESIIQMAEMEKLNEFYEKLNSLLGTNFETPMPHVTLYTTSSLEENKSKGIGIYSKSQFEELAHEKI